VRAICPKCGKAIVLCRENSSIGTQYRFREHGPVGNRCFGGKSRYFLHELQLTPVLKSAIRQECVPTEEKHNGQ
jgi:hypothetical protein